MQSIKSKFRRFVYRKETSHMLNYVTLRTTDPTLNRDILKWKGEHLQKIFWPLALIIFMSFLSTAHASFVT